MIKFLFLTPNEKNIKARVEGLRRVLKNKKVTEKDIKEAEVKIKELELRLGDAPVIPTLTLQNPTSEALGTLMEDNKERMALFSAEGGVFDTMAGIYTNGTPNVDIYLRSTPQKIGIF